MKVYSLLSFIDYEGSELEGVFESVEDVLKCVESGNGKWHAHDVGYVESELGEKLDNVLGKIVYVSFVNFRNEKVEV